MTLIIGVVGPFGSGCTYVAEILKNTYSYEYLSLSDILRDYAEKENQKIDFFRRENLQNYGNSIREKHGGGILAEWAIGKIRSEPGKNFVVDSIRNPAEVDCFRNSFPDFFLFGIFAEQDIRYARIKDKYSEDRREFEKDDKRDSGESNSFGQQVTRCFRSADIIILNNDEIRKGNDNERNFATKIKDKMDVLKKEIPFRPSPMETYMAMAYAVSMRSSCLKRKVGAVIVDGDGTLISSGYNEVPITQKPCLSEYGNCYRDTLKSDYKHGLESVIHDEVDREKAYSEFKKQFKILDYCRALHAEENAIIGVSKTGSSGLLAKARLFTSTYPCNLCANKIVQVGIKNVVYFEPYPMKEAKNILASGHVNQIPFEGVTYNGYFKLMEVVE